MLKAFNPTARLFTVNSPLSVPVSQLGVAVVAQMSLMVNLHFWFMFQEHTAQVILGGAEMILMFSVSCFQKSPYYMYERQHNPQLVSA